MSDSTLPFRRRTVLKTAGIAGIIGGTLAGRASASDHWTIETPDGWDDMSLKKQLKTVRKATKPYRKPGGAAADGYVNSGRLVCSHGFSYDRSFDDVVDPTYPHIITYLLSGKKLELAAAEYVVTGDHEDTPPDLFNDEGESLVLSEEDGWITYGGLTSLHVWVHEDNPDGIFAPRNSAVDDMSGCIEVPVPH